MILNVIKYTNANAIEATWLDDGFKQIASIAYADSQMDLLRADVAKYGGDLTDFADIIADVEANIQPYVEPVKTQSEINAEAIAYLASTDWLVARFSETGIAIPAAIKLLRQEARDSIV
jgi:hypothetical protein